MSFSTDLDAVRKRAGLPVIRRLRCSADGATFITISEQRAYRFIQMHDGFSDIYLEGPGRFRIKRFPVGEPTDPVWPWRVADAERPGVFGWARTHAAAIRLVDIMIDQPGAHGVVTDEDDEIVAYINGVAPSITAEVHLLGGPDA